MFIKSFLLLVLCLVTFRYSHANCGTELVIENFSNAVERTLQCARKVKLTNRDLKALDKGFVGKIFRNVEELTVEPVDHFNVDYKEVDLNFIKSFPNLIKFTMLRHDIRTITSKFEGNLKLREVELRSNLIKHLPSEIFSKLMELKSLSLFGNELQELDSNIFTQNVKLESLLIGANEISELPEKIFWANFLMKKLWMNNNEIENLPPNLLWKLKDLEDVNMANNQIEEVPENLFIGNSKLKIVELGGNQIKSVPQNLFKGLTELEKVHLYNNGIKILGAILRDSSKLNFLSFSGNQIKKIFPQMLHRNVRLSGCDGHTFNCGFLSNPCTQESSNPYNVVKCNENWNKTAFALENDKKNCPGHDPLGLSVGAISSYERAKYPWGTAVFCGSNFICGSSLSES